MITETPGLNKPLRESFAGRADCNYGAADALPYSGRHADTAREAHTADIQQPLHDRIAQTAQRLGVVLSITDGSVGLVRSIRLDPQADIRAELAGSLRDYITQLERLAGIVRQLETEPPPEADPDVEGTVDTAACEDWEPHLPVPEIPVEVAPLGSVAERINSIEAKHPRWQGGRIAKQVGCSPQTVQHWHYVRGQGPPEMVEAVLSGKKSLTAAHAELRAETKSRPMSRRRQPSPNSASPADVARCRDGTRSIDRRTIPRRLQATLRGDHRERDSTAEYHWKYAHSVGWGMMKKLTGSGWKPDRSD